MFWSHSLFVQFTSTDSSIRRSFKCISIFTKYNEHCHISITSLTKLKNDLDPNSYMLIPAVIITKQITAD